MHKGYSKFSNFDFNKMLHNPQSALQLTKLVGIFNVLLFLVRGVGILME